MSIHPSAIVDRHAKIDSSVQIGPYCVIDADVEIAAGCRLWQGVYLTGWTQIGPDCEIHPYAVIGHTPQDVKHGGERSYCRVGRSNIIRENVTIHRGTAPESETVIGNHCFLLAGAHVGHNCRIGNKVTLINDVILGGHVTVEDCVTIGGGTPVHQFVRIGELAMVAGGARVPVDVPPFALTDWLGRVAGLNRIGLRRNEYPREELTALREAYRTLYDKGLPFRQAVEALSREARSPGVEKLVRFLQAESRRGIAGRARSTSGSADEPQ